MQKPELILGPPGTGKTTALLEIIDKLLADGISPDSIAYVSFTRKAINEAKARAREKFGLKEKDLPYFRTLHSLAHRQVGVRAGDIMETTDYQVMDGTDQLEFSKYYDPEDAQSGAGKLGDQLRGLHDLAGATCRTLEQTWHDHADGEVTLEQLERYAVTLAEYKRIQNKLDFNDVLAQFVGNGEAVNVQVALVDEAQDLSALQWKVVHTAFENVGRLYIAGDDDQAIYKWNGADVQQFLSLDTDQRRVLNQSYRVPGNIFVLAHDIISGVQDRYPKAWQPRQASGSVERIVYPEDIDIVAGETTMLLARNAYLFAVWEAVCQQKLIPYNKRGVPFVKQDDLTAIKAWGALVRGEEIKGKHAKLVLDRIRGTSKNFIVDEHQSYTQDGLPVTQGDQPWYEVLNGIWSKHRDFYRAALRRGVDISAKPLVNIETIHRVKGGEADHVGLLSDISYRSFQSALEQPDDEARVFYVAATRARNKLTLVEPQTGTSYAI